MLSSDRAYLYVLRLLLVVGFLALVIVLFRLQVAQGEYYRRIAENNYVRLVRIPPVRGEIFDRRNRPLVVNAPTINLYITPGLIDDDKALERYLQSNLGIPTSEFRAFIEEKRKNPLGAALLSANVSYEIFVRVSEDLNFFPSLTFRRENGRKYLIPAHFLGYIGRIGEQEYERLQEEGYQRDDFLGKAGLEKTYESLLRGEAGYEVRQVDARGKSLDLLKHNLQKEHKPGLQLVLSIDLELQQYVREQLSAYQKAAAVAIDPRTGEVLAWVSEPGFDQNRFMRRISNDEWQALVSDPNNPLLDRVHQGGYPPGSVYKPLVASLALERGLVTPLERLTECRGGMQLGDRWMECWDPRGHGRTNVYEAIKMSCDVYFYDLSGRLDLDDWREWNRLNGWSETTGVDLPTRKTGFFPSTAWYKERYGRYVSIRGHMANLSIGQGEVMTSPLHVCCYYAALADNGVWRAPHFFRRVIGEEASEVNRGYHSESHTLPLSQETLDVLRKALWKVVNEVHGTASTARVEGATVYGKTGSAENHLGEDTHAWFAGWAEWSEPEIVVTVFVENAGHGGAVAAPIAGRILDYYARNVRTNP